MHQAPDNVLTQALTCSPERMQRPSHTDWHLVWLSEHFTKLRHLHKLPLKKGFTITSGGYQSFRLQINLGMKGNMYYTDMYYME